MSPRSRCVSRVHQTAQYGVHSRLKQRGLQTEDVVARKLLMPPADRPLAELQRSARHIRRQVKCRQFQAVEPPVLEHQLRFHGLVLRIARKNAGPVRGQMQRRIALSPLRRQSAKRLGGGARSDDASPSISDRIHSRDLARLFFAFARSGHGSPAR